LIEAEDRPGFHQRARGDPQGADPASINRRDPAGVLAEYAAWLAEQPLSARTRKA
jgi:hypothetical protein